MNSEGIGQPHDRLVRQVFSRKETAARFLEAYLPPTLAASLEWSRLELHPGSYVDARLRHQESDLLFCVPFRGVGKTQKSPQNLLLYCLFEHQRNVEPWMILRLLGYMLQIWQGLIRSNPKMRRLPPILPVVLYQGPTRWNIAVRFEQHLALPKELAAELNAYQPMFEHVLVDLSRSRVEELKGDIIGRLALGLLKAVAEGKVAAWLERAGPLLAQLLHEQEATGIVETLLRYLVAVDSDLDLRAVQRALAKAPVTRTQIMSIAEQMIQKGRQEGQHEGALLGQIQLMQELLGLRVTSLTHLSSRPESELRKLAAQLRARLRKQEH